MWAKVGGKIFLSQKKRLSNFQISCGFPSSDKCFHIMMVIVLMCMMMDDDNDDDKDGYDEKNLLQRGLAGKETCFAVVRIWVAAQILNHWK